MKNKLIVTILFLSMTFLFYCTSSEDSYPPSVENVEKSLLSLSYDWSKVLFTKDTTPMEQIWAADFSYIRSDGSVFNKEEGIAVFNNDTNTYTDAIISNFKVRLYKRDFDVTTGDYKETGQDKDGKAFEYNSRFTNVWIKQSGLWQCVAGHASDLQ